ncbi:hypothetical protein TVAG_337190 [Trichomonas vaginalis G3]|uniref:RRM domain-containing protein n=1 Tax=Trichomonas vaginalis (strain ATCC PRA-98 / G3) TaxID=412133 RepID=A2FS07_TRIV3|nr:eukaryotic translation initiation factor 3 subunit G family [Trichomonas vaginalis G3]EAX92299.1 hypothetical protein TVAG_337190 [Trichomonas vaginalis G3]KAI5549767.1 eukaryotic translation initiation factor 3 subunit G family [Trichomonas vaginalis G3]|eukprot:XP_001305229.1 hypothetical protein [Trichomonas vaginalis G3]
MCERPTTRIRVEGFDEQTSEQSIKQKFNTYGVILSVTKDKKAFIIEFATVEAACAAKQKANGLPISCQQTATIFFDYPNMPDFLAIQNCKEEKLPEYKSYLKTIPEFDEMIPFRTDKGFTSLVIATFSEQVDFDKLIQNIKEKFPTEPTAYEKVPYCNLSNDSLHQIARSFEERSIFMNNLNHRIPEEKITEIYSKYGKVIYVDISFKYEVYIITILMDTKENAQKAIEELDKTVFVEDELPLRVFPFIEKTIYHKPAGIISVNELEYNFDTKQLYTTFKQWGEIYAFSVSHVASSFVALFLYADYQNALKARDSCNYSNVFVFPKMNAAAAVRHFTQRKFEPDLTLVTFDNENIPNLFLRSEYENVQDFHTFTNGNNKTVVVTFKCCQDLQNTINKIHKRYEIIGSSTFNRVFEYFKTQPIDSVWAKRIFYARGINSDLSNKVLREKFSNIAPVDSIVNLGKENIALVLFKRSVDANNKEFLTILPNQVSLDDVINSINESSKPSRTQSWSAINPNFLPINSIIEEATRREPTLRSVVEKHITSINYDQVLELSLEPAKLNSFFKQLISDTSSNACTSNAPASPLSGPSSTKGDLDQTD